MGELRLPGLGAGAARPAPGPWTGDGVGDRGNDSRLDYLGGDFRDQILAENAANTNVENPMKIVKQLDNN